MKMKVLVAFAIVTVGAYSCVSPKKLQEAEQKYGTLNTAYADLQSKYRDAQDAVSKSKNDADKFGASNKSMQATIDDLNRLRKSGVAGVVLGKALYSGQIDLTSAISACYK